MENKKYLNTTADIDDFERAVEAGINALTDDAKARLLEIIKDAPKVGDGRGMKYGLRPDRVHFDYAKHVKDYEHVYQTEVSAYVLDRNTVLGFLFVKNGCCPDRPVLLVGTETVSGMYYSCQCACGEFITGMFKEPADAVAAYENMFGDRLPF